MREDWSDFDNPPPLGGRRPRGSRGRGGRRPVEREDAPRRSLRDHDEEAPVRTRRHDERRSRDHDDRDAPPPRRRPSEQQVYLGHPHWRSMIGFYVRGLGGVALVGLALYLGHAAGMVPLAGVIIGPLVLVSAVMWIASLVRRTTVYRITTRRVSKRWGIVMKFSEEAPLRRIQNVSVSQSIPQRLLGVGTVDFDTAGEREDQDMLRFRGVRHPWAVKGLVPYDDEDDLL